MVQTSIFGFGSIYDLSVTKQQQKNEKLTKILLKVANKQEKTQLAYESLV